MSSISFFSEDTDFVLKNQRKTRNWIRQVISNEGYLLKTLNYIFCSDEYLHEINLKYLSHTSFTDIITFDQSDIEMEIEGDIYISIDRVKENSISFNNTFQKELYRVMIHGVLHLLGYSDKSEEEIKVIRIKEDSCLSLYSF